MKITVDQARPDDEDRLAEIDRVTRSPQVTPAPDPPPDRPFFDERTAVEDVLVARADGEAVGFAGIKGAYPEHVTSAAHVQEVFVLAVHPDHEGRGAGRALLEAADAVARRRGARRIKLRVLSTNPRALALYERSGYVVEGVCKREFHLDGAWVDDVLMAREF